MKKIMTFLSMIALAFVGTMMIGCSNKEYDIEKPEQSVESENAITLTTTISLPDAETDTDETKALNIDYGNKKLSKTFKVGEQVALIYKKTNVTSDKVIYTLTEGDITNEGKTATLTFTVSNPNYEEAVTYVYPAIITGGEYKASVDYTRLNTQDGTLASIASDLDLATYTGPWDGENLPSANLTNELALIAYTLKNEGGTSDLTSSITGMSISDGTNTYVVNREAAEGPIYVAIRPTSGATINYTATDGTYYYTKSVNSKTYEAGQFYQLGLRMKQSSAVGHGLFFSTVGEVVANDGLAYPATAKGNLPAGVTPVGMVAYKDGNGKSGLVIALTDESSTMGWGTANGNNGAKAHKPVIEGHAWKLPSLDDWTHIKGANGNTWTGLNTALASAGGTGVVGGANRYWTSDKFQNDYWFVTMKADGTMGSGFTDSGSYYVRACFSFELDRNAFSVSPTTKVTFASGNLRYTGSKWEFLSNSWDCGYNGNHGKTSGSQYFAWNDVFKDASVSTASDIEDDVANDLGSTWRGLSIEEWRYLMGYDGNATPEVQSSRRAVAWHRYAMVDDTQLGEGRYLLIFPDGFNETDWNTSTMGTKPTQFEQNGILYDSSYTTSNFTAMQDAGIVILPKSGCWLDGWGLVYEGTGRYWSSTCADAYGAMALIMNAPGVNLTWMDKSVYNFPVRLVKNK